MPDKQALLDFLRDNPDQSGKREIARAFGLKAQQKIKLKSLLKELAEEGAIKKRGKRFTKPGTLPSVTVLDIIGRDAEGGLIAQPVQWDENTDGERPTVIIERSSQKKAVTSGVGDRVLARISQRGTEQATARVMKVVDKNRGTVLGVYRAIEAPERGMVARIEPVDRKIDELMVYEQNAGDAENGDLVEVSVVGRNSHGLKQAKVQKIIGDFRSERAVSMIALHQHNIPVDFPDAVVSEARSAKPAPLERREDWRDVPLITIDPADAKDHDDAIYACDDDDPKNPDGMIVYVAIADVSWYVRTGSAMDREASERGNSVYFPDRVVPMLPEALSNDLCSLKEGVDRAALAARMVFEKSGRKICHSFHRIMMKSHARLSYQEAQAAIDGEPAPRAEPHLDAILKPLWRAYAILEAGRAFRDPLELDLPERKLLLNDKGEVERVIVPPRLDAHKLVEEFMIQANVSAAQTLEKQKQNLIYRIHDAPTLAKLEALRQFLRTLNIPLSKGGPIKPETFNRILAQVKGTDNEELVNSVILRSQSQAEYNPQNIGHFGLNLRKYAHFASPIRRYADLTVHRALVASNALGDGGWTYRDINALATIAEQISQTERRAMLAERQTTDRLIAGFLAEKIGAEFSGRINGVTRAGLFITLDETGADGFVPISKLGREYFHYDEVSHRVIGEDTGLIFQLGDRVQVELVEAAPIAGALRFAMLSEGRPGDGLPRTKRSRSGSPSGRPRRPRRSNRFGKPV